jgi:hypothetical protein
MIECPFTGQSKPRCYGGGRGIATSIKGKNRKVTLVTVAVGAEMFAGMSGVVMASGRDACCWLAFGPAPGPQFGFTWT